jgi:hypothetical protein
MARGEPPLVKRRTGKPLSRFGDKARQLGRFQRYWQRHMAAYIACGGQPNNLAWSIDLEQSWQESCRWLREGVMRGSLRKGYLGVILCSLTGVASAAPLTVVKVAAPDINCVFETDCTIVVTDSVGLIPLPTVTGVARLQSRTFAGQPGAPAAGKTGYEYRLDLTQATAIGDVACVTALDVDFGPVTKLQYNKVGPADDVFVITKGGLGTIGLASAVQNRNIITFTFSQPVCAADTSGPGQTTFFFGLASIHPPKAIVATVEVPGLFPGVDVKARAPNH